MSDTIQNERRARIEKAAFDLLAEKGFHSTSMLQIAKRASASNQTLYSWYGNKQGLFREIIKENGAKVRALLVEGIADHPDPLGALSELGPLLLRFTTDQKAAIINRAAIADASETGLLRDAIEEHARGEIYPLICALLNRLHQDGYVDLDRGAEDAADAYLGLLFGEMQLRQAMGAIGPATDDQIMAKAQRATELFARLYRASANKKRPHNN